jgi:OOP family OmpA-OmpF porin
MSKESPPYTRASGASAFAELRGLLLAPEQEDLRQLRRSLENAQSAENISRLLPEAVRLAARRNWKLQTALLPVVERSIRISVRQDPGILTGVLSPIIGAAVKNAVVSAVRHLAESLQETVEQSFSLRGIRWRIEAARSGRPYGEILLVHSLLYRVDQVFLIHAETGLLLTQVSAEPGNTANGDLVSAMLTAIQDFIKDSFGASGPNAVEVIEAGEFVIWAQQSSQVILAALIRGVPPKGLKAVFESVLERVCLSHSTAISRFDGDVSLFHSCKQELAACLLGKGKRARRILWPLWALVGAVALVIAAAISWQLYELARWQGFVETLSREPGIVVTESARRGGKYFVSGMRDPLARDPETLLHHAGFSPQEVNFDWQSYLSLQPPFVKIREFADAKRRVEVRRIHFPMDHSELSTGQMDAVEDVAEDINDLLRRAARVGKKIKIEIVGDADNSGTDEHNAKLSDRRASEVAAALISVGIPSGDLYTGTLSTAETKNISNDYQNSPFSRNVSFHVISN